MSIRIREYAPPDLEGCRDLWRALTQRHRDIYEDPTIGGDDPGMEFDEHLQHAALANLWVAEEDGELVGFCGLLVEGEESELEPIVVSPERRSGGVGAALARTAIAESRRLGMKFINVRPVGRNLEAIRFFHRQGFQLLGRLELCIPLEEGSAKSTPADAGFAKKVDIHALSFFY